MNEPTTEPAGAAEPNRAGSSGVACESESPGRRSLRWMLNLLASGLVLIASLVAGREVLLWWRSPADVAGSADGHDQPPGFDFENGFVDLRFGAAPVVVRREVVSGSRELVLETLRRNSAALADDVLALRVFRGYSGWGPGQLDSELVEGAWMVFPAEPDDVFCANPDDLWRTVVRRQGGKVAWLANAPDDLSSN